MPFDPNAPRKPFVARGSRTDRCNDCLLSKPLCICSFRSAQHSNAVFWLLTHHDEQYKPTNTGRLIVDTVQNSELFIWARTELDARLELLLASSDYYPVIVFPSDELHQERMVSANQVVNDSIKVGKQPAFILLDGTWRQARRMFRLSEYLQDIPVIEPSLGRKSRYHLRKASEDNHLCTAEVAAVILKDIGEELVANRLDQYFDLFNASYFASRVTSEKAFAQVEDAKARMLGL